MQSETDSRPHSTARALAQRARRVRECVGRLDRVLQALEEIGCTDPVGAHVSELRDQTSNESHSSLITPTSLSAYRREIQTRSTHRAKCKWLHDTASARMQAQDSSWQQHSSGTLSLRWEGDDRFALIPTDFITERPCTLELLRFKFACASRSLNAFIMTHRPSAAMSDPDSHGRVCRALVCARDRAIRRLAHARVDLAECVNVAAAE
jgi:hypothetical protein